MGALLGLAGVGAASVSKDGRPPTVWAAAEANANATLRHRERVGKAVEVSMRMLAELDGSTEVPSAKQQAPMRPTSTSLPLSANESAGDAS
jgi:hypothetical protein